MNLDKHIDKAVELHKAAFEKLDNWEKARQTALTALKKEISKMNEQAARDANAAFVNEWNGKRTAIIAELAEGMAAVDSAFMQDVADFYRPNGKDIAPEDQALLASGILTQEELAEMVIRHSENPTMLRIISRFAIASKCNFPTDIKRAIVRATSGGENERRAYSTFKQLIYAPVRMAEQNMVNTEVFINCALKADEYANDAKMRLTRAKLYLTNADREFLKKAEDEQRKRDNAANGFKSEEVV